MFGDLILISLDFDDYIFPFSYFFSFSLYIKHSCKTLFDHISNNLKVRQKYSAACCIFNSLLGVWKCGQTLPLVLDILLQYLLTQGWRPEPKETSQLILTAFYLQKIL